MDGANSAPVAMAPGAAENLRADGAGWVQPDLLGGPAVPAVLTPAYEPGTFDITARATPIGAML